jgi:hypothetical protein
VTSGSSGSGRPEKMAEVSGLAAAIANRILEQHEAGTSIPPEQFTMLVRAARMLLDNGVQWPPSVGYLVMEVAKRVGRTEPTTKGDSVVVHLGRDLTSTKRS